MISNNISFTAKVICTTENISKKDFAEFVIKEKKMVLLKNMLEKLEKIPDSNEDTITLTFTKLNGDEIDVKGDFKVPDAEKEAIVFKDNRFYNDYSKIIPLFEFIRDDQIVFIKEKIAKFKAEVKERLANVKAGQEVLDHFFNANS